MSEELKPCRRCDAPCSVQVIDGATVKATLWMCSEGMKLGGQCEEPAYLSQDAWNDRPEQSANTQTHLQNPP